MKKDGKRLIVHSETQGLWMRFFFRLIPLWLVAFYILFIYVDYLGIEEIIQSSQYSTFALMVLLGAGWVTVQLLRDSPLRWENTVVFDLDQKSITIYKNRDNKRHDDILDYKEEIIQLDNLVYSRSKQYESFLHDAYYLVSVSDGQKEIPLVSIKDPSEYTQLLHLLKQELNLPLR